MLASISTYLMARFSREDGATMVEYGLIVAVIALIVVAGAFLLGTNLNTLFNDTATCVATPTAPC